MLKIKIISVLLLAHAVHPGDKVVYGPTPDGLYAVPGEGFIPTKDCTVTAEGMEARFDGRFITFLDRDGEEEGQCEIGERPVKVEWHGMITRQIAVTK